MDVGVPMAHFNGAISLAGQIREGKLSALAGSCVADSMSLAERPVSDFRASITKPADRSELSFSKIGATVAGGTMAGDVKVSYPEDGPSHYDLSLHLRNADFRELSLAQDNKITGSVSASLNLSGSWTDQNARRGRGDVLVTGDNMYQVPLMLGWMQVTNLSLPISSPFQRATAQYNVDGTRVNLEQLSLRSNDMMMQGGGHIDFATRKVSLTFTTNNPRWPSLPIVGPLMDAAHSELMRIHVVGSLKDPKVSATSFDTITTTVDQVLKGDARD
jgi:hypothetical protein